MSPKALSPEVLAPILAGFFQECEDLLGELELGLLALQAGERDWEIVDSVFRAVHSVKGGAGAFGLDGLGHFAHVFETALAGVRARRVAIEPDLLKLMLQSADVLADLVHAARDGGAPDPARTQRLEIALATVTPPDAEAPTLDDDDPFDLDFTPLPVELELADEIDPGVRGWTVRFRPTADLYATANEPLRLLRELERLGAAAVTLNERDIPLLSALAPEAAYLEWTVRLDTAADEDAIRDVFAFVEGDCELSLGRATPDAPEGPIDEVSILPVDAAASPAPPQPAPHSPGDPSRTIRVDLERVDRLINLVGELVINQSMLAQRVSEAGIAAEARLEQPLDDFDHLTRELQESVMAIRSQPVTAVFQRMSRLVREIEAVTGKQVKLVTAGEATEVDRTVIERLTDPLTHMIRNAIDHGVEPPAERLAAGKPEQGTLKISAAHRAGRIVIQVSDDGRGIDRVRVRAVAVERGLIAADAALTDEETDNLIFAAGFSTAREVSELSGRGVGMDVVRRGVQALGGRIVVASIPGEGSTFTLSLPLTLAVLDGMVVSVCGHSLIAPLTTLLESVQPTPQDIRRLGGDVALLNFHGEHLPLIDLGMALKYRDRAEEAGARVALVVEDDTGARAALLVDEILGQRQVVIKSLAANYRPVAGVAAATILGDGRVALILDVNAIIAAQGHDAPANTLQLTTG